MAEDKEKTLQFIADYRRHQVLWDQTDIDYTNKSKRNVALTALSLKYNMDKNLVKNKIKSVRSYFAKEHKKVLAKRRDDEEANCQSTWFAYESLLFILNSRNIVEHPSEIPTEDETPNKNEYMEESTNCNATPARLSEDEHEFIEPIRKIENINRLSTDSKHTETYKVTKTEEEMSNKDGCTIFGELIANKLRNLTRRNRVLAEHRISNIFFDLELEEIDAAQRNHVENVIFTTTSTAQFGEASASTLGYPSTSTEDSYTCTSIDYCDSKAHIKHLTTEHQDQGYSQHLAKRLRNS